MTPSLSESVSNILASPSFSLLEPLTFPRPHPVPSDFPVSVAERIPPELLLDIFTIVSNSPSETHEQYLERNRTLQACAIVHSSWKCPAQEVLQTEIYIRTMDRKGKSRLNKIERIAGQLVTGRIQGAKYLTVDGYLNELVARTPSTMWDQVGYLKLMTSSSSSSSTRMSDLASFPRELLSLLSLSTRLL